MAVSKNKKTDKFLNNRSIYRRWGNRLGSWEGKRLTARGMSNDQRLLEEK